MQRRLRLVSRWQLHNKLRSWIRARAPCRQLHATWNDYEWYLEADYIWAMFTIIHLLSSHLPSRCVKIKITQKVNFTCSFVLVWNLVAHITVRKQIAGDWEQDAEEDIWKQEATGHWRIIHNEELHNSYSLKISLGQENKMSGACGTHGSEDKTV
jgi:hypothetical protein